MRFSLLTIVLIGCAISTAQGAISHDGSCGKGNECASGSCCSEWGYCGTGPAFCNSNSKGGGEEPDSEHSDEHQPTKAPGGDNSGSNPQQATATATSTTSTSTAGSKTTSENKPTGTNTGGHASEVSSISPVSAYLIALGLTLHLVGQTYYG
ncbi:hypothetical protein K493DRAFT_298215 [Basidiobolus meristosporus CBS 931.73]|uniref:Chitin-binding type-1 domain-containing protein n=1 Tax=Basidiobolus meristosporus CBS 931.73 TaxID=1314790 RepID=A0A1Y1YUQ4_9FUNG|nr:hypothetical protein K493DRAFT_298215 [Basidiobolus meristosporus CBS 931.73]|eukprot:ORY01773.1 hypothetical protein K493DRAFT_298215 [Basidiobolus meristosporus CBS 931.73]